MGTPTLLPDGAAPRATVVIPAYKVATYIEATVRSVLGQSMAEIECIVVDDGSPDEGAMIVEGIRDPRIRLIRQPNGGVSSARNAGWKAARSEAVLFLDGDDILHPTAIERLHRALDTAPQAAAVFGTTLRTDAAGVLEPNQKPLERHGYASGDVLEEVIVHHRVFSNGGQMLIRKSAVAAAGGYDQTLRLSEDWEFFCRLAAVGPCVFIGPQEEVMRHRVRTDSAAPTLSKDWTNHLDAVRRVMENDSLRQRFSPRHWRRLLRDVEATHVFEAGRQNFIHRRFRDARRYMIQGLMLHPSKKRVVVFAAAQASQILRRPLLSRLRFAA
jgi:glycosyltransferase involved in cell wall biosynthesis